MASHPLTHHQILALAEPFARRGLHVDLAATDRLERRLVFRSVDHGDWRETLRLENPFGDTLRLTRVLAPAAGPEARLETEGRDAGELLARIDSVPAAAHFAAGPGYRLARSFAVEAPPSGGRALVLTRGAATIGGLEVTLRPSGVHRVPADVEFTARSGERIDLPEDLLAVLGWGWGLLRGEDGEWRTTVAVPGREPVRSQRAQARFDRLVEHVTTTLAEPPARFQSRWLGARWRVVLRRLLPLVIGIALLGGALGTARLDLASHPLLRMLILNSPTVLFVLVFCLREVPRVEIPPLPRRGNAGAWRAATPSRPPHCADPPLVNDAR